MSEYQLTSTDAIKLTRTLKGYDDKPDRVEVWIIPNDPDNRDRVEYELWLQAGGVPDPRVEA